LKVPVLRPVGFFHPEIFDRNVFGIGGGNEKYFVGPASRFAGIKKNRTVFCDGDWKGLEARSNNCGRCGEGLGKLAAAC